MKYCSRYWCYLYWYELILFDLSRRDKINSGYG